MSLSITLGLLTALLALAGLAIWRLRRPWQPGRLWRIPWNAILALSLIVILGLLAHLFSLWSGHPLAPRGLGR